ncbi:Hypothetical predicted protein [Pelobates cultripes]|uniref:Uncharacterized protein n=1 Tax=Pelobates cultripes TaxID=61616 RepID=A0AAD1T5P4_PELCU|nr:Hypothetical predicted protein [Pelobates cultripes]CAH2319284.1 Hypothetical predicted protein [Pelobates cultripes]
MSQPKSRRQQDKLDKTNFFSQKKVAALAIQSAAADQQDGAEHSGGSSPGSEADSPQNDGLLTITTLKQALEEQSQRLISIWQSSVAELKRDIQDIGSRTTHVETKMEDLIDAHNASTEQIKSLSSQLQHCKTKIMDLEDRSRRSNIRLRGIPETILQADLPSYVHGLFKALAPEVHTDMLLLDRLHRIPKPQQIAASLPRDVLLKAHYFHVKDLLMRRSRTAKDLPMEYAAIKMFSDLSAATLRQRKTFQRVTETLRANHILYRWGFPVRLIASRNGTTTTIHTVEEGLDLLRQWNLPVVGDSQAPKGPRRVEKDWHTTN